MPCRVLSETRIVRTLFFGQSQKERLGQVCYFNAHLSLQQQDFQFMHNRAATPSFSILIDLQKRKRLRKEEEGRRRSALECNPSSDVDGKLLAVGTELCTLLSLSPIHVKERKYWQLDRLHQPNPNNDYSIAVRLQNCFSP